MLKTDTHYQTALHDFNDARAKASMQEVLSRLTGISNELLSYEEVAHKLKLQIGAERGLQEIPLKAIIGSVGRYTDFTRSFLPLRDTDREHWAQVKVAIDDPFGAGLPPIDVYKVGEIYFVLDGNQRVSVARQEGFDFIQAHVVEVKTTELISAEMQLDDIIIQLEYADFIEKTNLPALFPLLNLSVTIPGQYKKILEHIQVHRYFMGIDFKRDVSYPEAVSHWVEAVYQPIIDPIRERGLLRWFPNRTETDLYLWVSEYRHQLAQHLGLPVSPDAAVADLTVKEKSPSAETAAVESQPAPKPKILNRYIDQLFSDIIVPLDGQNWLPLEQATVIARKEACSIQGLHVIPVDDADSVPQIIEIQSQFNQRCRDVNASGYLTDSLNIVKGSVPDQICQNALLADLIVMNADPEHISPGICSIIWRSARPILTIPGKVSRMEHALLAFDGSLKSREALFVAAYIAERWKTALTVLTVSEDGQVPASAPDYARSYLKRHDIQADFLTINDPLDVFLDVIKERSIDLVLMGGYSGTALKTVTLGEALNLLITKANCPILICR